MRCALPGARFSAETQASPDCESRGFPVGREDTYLSNSDGSCAYCDSELVSCCSFVAGCDAPELPELAEAALGRAGGHNQQHTFEEHVVILPGRSFLVGQTDD